MAISPYASCGATLVDNGYSAIPVRPGTKLPGSMSFGEWYGEMNWQRFADRLPTSIETPLWSRWKDAGVCVVLGWGGLIAIDIDTEDAEITAAILRTIPESPVQKKGAKGRTLFYRGNVLKTDKTTGEITGHIPSRGFNVGNERALDLLAYGKQTILPPSVHPSGMPYEWITEDTLVDTPIEKLPELPDDIADRIAVALEPFGYTAPEPHTMVSVGSSDSKWREIKDLAFANLAAWVPALGLPKTKRHNANNWRAVAAWRGVENANLSFTPKGIKDFGTDETHSPIDVVMLAHGSDIETATRWLGEILGYKEPDADGFDVDAFIERSQKRAYVSPPAQTVIESDTPIAPVRAPRGSIDPFDYENAGGLLGSIAKFTSDTAYRPSREFAMMAAIGFMSAICNRRYVTPAGFGTNIYLIGLSPPSFGKEHPQNVIKTLAHDSGMSFLLGAGEVSSGSAIEKVVRRAPNSIMVWDELGIILQSISGFKAPGHADSIRKVLLDIYSKSRHGSMWYGKETADPKKDNSPIHSPTISLLGFSTTTEFYKGLPESSLRDGFLARLLIIQAEVRGERQKAPPLLIPTPSLIEIIKATANANPSGKNLVANFRAAQSKPTLYPVKFESVEAEQAWMQVDDWQLSVITEDHGQFGIVGRASENTQKLATLRAVSRCPETPLVTAEDIQWGYAIVQRSLDNVDTGVSQYMADSEHERLCKAILEVLRNSKTGAMSVSTMIRRKGIAKFDERARGSALKDLVISGQVVQAGKTYKLVEITNESANTQN